MKAANLSHDEKKLWEWAAINRICGSEFTVETQVDAFGYTESKIIVNTPGE